mmetsp:Transcript_71720/g.233150  ORF Transcript_71720/g.233150 Transcript_71720/m.233150 type:complete len:389 (-) Transcript_71720:1007-2173(-)
MQASACLCERPHILTSCEDLDGPVGPGPADGAYGRALRATIQNLVAAGGAHAAVATRNEGVALRHGEANHAQRVVIQVQIGHNRRRTCRGRRIASPSATAGAATGGSGPGAVAHGSSGGGRLRLHLRLRMCVRLRLCLHLRLRMPDREGAGVGKAAAGDLARYSTAGPRNRTLGWWSEGWWRGMAHWCEASLPGKAGACIVRRQPRRRRLQMLPPEAAVDADAAGPSADTATATTASTTATTRATAAATSASNANAMAGARLQWCGRAVGAVPSRNGPRPRRCRARHRRATGRRRPCSRGGRSGGSRGSGGGGGSTGTGHGRSVGHGESSRMMLCGAASLASLRHVRARRQPRHRRGLERTVLPRRRWRRREVAPDRWWRQGDLNSCN